MSWGLENRLSRIIRPQDGRTVMLAVDHGYFLGPTSGLECPGATVVPLAPYADTLMLTRGMLRTCIPSSVDTPIVLRVSGANSVLDDDLSNETIITDIEEVIRLTALLGMMEGQPEEGGAQADHRRDQQDDQDQQQRRGPVELVGVRVGHLVGDGEEAHAVLVARRVLLQSDLKLHRTARGLLLNGKKAQLRQLLPIRLPARARTPRRPIQP